MFQVCEHARKTFSAPRRPTARVYPVYVVISISVLFTHIHAYRHKKLQKATKIATKISARRVPIRLYKRPRTRTQFTTLFLCMHDSFSDGFCIISTFSSRSVARVRGQEPRLLLFDAL